MLAITEVERRKLTETIERWSSNLIASTEDEKYRVAKDLNDGINQTIYAAKLMLQNLLFDITDNVHPKKIVPQIIQIQRTLDESIKEIKKVTQFLKPDTYTQISIVSEIHNLTYEFSKRINIQCIFTTNDFHKILDSEIELVLYRITEEALINIEEHSEATLMEVSLLFDNGKSELKISDNGVGFDLELYKINHINNSQFGLISIFERVNIVEGKCKIISSPGNGTEIVVTIPLNKFSLDETKLRS